MSDTEIVTKRVCRDCGAEYMVGGLAARHKAVTGHTGGFCTVKVERPRAPTRTSYQPGYISDLALDGPAWLHENCPGGLSWDCCMANDCGVGEDGARCDRDRLP